MPNLTITVETLEHAGKTVRIARIAGAADATNVDEINAAIQQLISGPETSFLVVEGSQLSYINSTFIGYLTEWYQTLMDRSGALLLAQLQPQPRDTLAVVGLLGLIPSYYTLDEAKLALATGNLQPQA